ncbi:cell division ATP-binding protein FtsE [Nesterenkonia massiliensis]|uniref:Cell division ATP-binding protein FtsE n=1 Tax=Nesterenkonia massiliensis TaxID=1232429 RepID=A0ABT2HTD7_9MICC|nr:cell division ATP-binding protein FtsE [Nesterenkonia massiliensis]MCT1607964.1 cell division ATP-binding protein FtsE [Nesterenkonia massiliensis]
MIRFDQVSRYYQSGGKPALEDVTVEFNRGDFVFLIGASGSGKSTLLRMILREGLPQRGKITVAGQNLARMLERRVPEYRRSIGMVFQDFRLLPDKTVYENVAFAMRVIGAPRTQIRKRVMKILSRVGLEHLTKRYPHEISGGEQQRAAIARAIVNSPAILLADEPTGNLDPRAAEEVMKILRWINASGTTVIMATHDRAIVDRMARRVVQLHRGKLVRDQQDGSYDAPEGSYAWELLTKEQEESGLRAHDPAPLLTQAVPMVAVGAAAEHNQQQGPEQGSTDQNSTAPNRPEPDSPEPDSADQNSTEHNSTEHPHDGEAPLEPEVAPGDQRDTEPMDSAASLEHEPDPAPDETSVADSPGAEVVPEQPMEPPAEQENAEDSAAASADSHRVIPREFRVTWPEDASDADPIESSSPAGVDAADMPALDGEAFEESPEATPQESVETADLAADEPETDALTPVPPKPIPGQPSRSITQSRLAWLFQSEESQGTETDKPAADEPAGAARPEVPKPRASASEASYSDTRRTAEQLRASKRGIFGRRGSR